MNLFGWSELVADGVLHLLNLSADSAWGSSVHFLVADLLKIGLMLLVINYLMAISRYYLPLQRIKNTLSSRRWHGLDYVLAALFGLVTPFCSCSSIPLFIGFLGAGIPIGVTFTFLITSPLINEASLALFPALLGWRIALLYNLLGMLVGIMGGVLIERLNVKRWIEPSFLAIRPATSSLPDPSENKPVPLSSLLMPWWREGWKISRSILPYVVLGVGVGAAIHGLIPADWIEQHLNQTRWWQVPLAALLGVPLYANSVSVVPIMTAFVDKGIPLGTALAFMTATVTLSFPEAMILKKTMRWPLLILYYGITTLGIMLMGWLFNLLPAA